MVAITEIIDALTEAPTDPFPIHQISNNEWRIDTQGSGDIVVLLENLTESGFTLTHLSFRNSSGFTADNTMTTKANRVLWSVIEVAKQVSTDLYVFYPADNNEVAITKKTSLYAKLILTLKRYGIVTRTNRIDYQQPSVFTVFWAMTSVSKAKSLSDTEIQTLIENAVVAKWQPLVDSPSSTQNSNKKPLDIPPIIW